MIHAQIDHASLRRVIDSFSSSDGQIRRAQASALRKMQKRIETEVKRQAARELRLPQRAIGDRFFSDRVPAGADSMRLWIGTWHISPFSIGAVSTYGIPGKSGGVKAGKRTYRGAFLARIYSGRTKVWIRLHSGHYSPELYPTIRRPGDRGLSGQRGRFPVVRAAVPIDAVLEKVIIQYEPDMVADFKRLFTQELNYQTNVRGKS